MDEGLPYYQPAHHGQQPHAHLRNQARKTGGREKQLLAITTLKVSRTKKKVFVFLVAVTYLLRAVNKIISKFPTLSRVHLQSGGYFVKMKLKTCPNTGTSASERRGEGK